MGLIEMPPGDVYITGELERRTPKKIDHLLEKRAIHELAARMVDEPEAVLPKFVELAMEIAGGVAAGLSLYEENPPPGVFRWRYLTGILAPFEGATTPRNFSPCGITLDQDRPVLSRHPERMYNWISDAKIVVPEVLLVPLYLRGREPLGTLWIVSDKEGHFDSGHARAMTELASFVSIALRMVQSEKRMQQSLSEQEMLTREMSHRIKNLFAVTDAMIRISARGANTKEELSSALSGRLRALGTAHGLIRRSFSEGVPPTAVSELGELIATILKPHESVGASRFILSGPKVALGEHAVNGTALLVHELATNAAKYGALKNSDGRITIGWSLDADQLRLTWTERGGPRLEGEQPSDGFGSKLLRDTVMYQFAGAMEQDWQAGGLCTTLTLPAKNLDS